jgi:hypothetical protein
MDELELLRRIVKAVAKEEPIYDSDSGDTYCVYCSADDPLAGHHNLTHEPHCPYRLAVEYQQSLSKSQPEGE